LRILHIYKDYYPVLGGIENHVRVLAEAQAADGHAVTVVVCSLGHFTSQEYLNGVHIIRAGRVCTLASMPISLSQPFFILRQKSDIVHIHSPYPLGEISAWIFKRKIPLVITYHSDIVNQKRLLRLYGPLLRMILDRARIIIGTSPRYIETSPWLFPSRNNYRVIPLGVDPNIFKPAGIPHPPGRRLLFVGKLRYYKSLDTLFHALSALSGVVLSVAGSGSMKKKWTNVAKQAGVADRVHFLGEIPDADLPELYHNADLFVLPANCRAEAFGTVLLEAMASGLPCITTEIGTGTTWLVKNGVTGLVVQPDDPAALAEAIDSLLSDDAMLKRMGCAGRARIEAEFTSNRMIDRVMKVYAEAVGVNSA